MSRQVTVAAFDIAAKAELAKNILEEAGIAAYIHDEGIVAMEWILANAVGGIKVKVEAKDAERAERVLNERYQDAVRAGVVDDEELARQALAAGEVEPSEELEPPANDRSPEPPTTVPGAPESRESYARRAYLTAFFSILFPPLVFYALYLWMNAAFSDEPLSPQGRPRLRFTTLFLILPLVLTAMWMMVFGSPEP